MNNKLIGYALLFAVLLSGCSLHTAVNHIPLKKNKTQNLMVFFDGTANDEKSRTNIAKLHNLVTLQNRSDVSTSYIKGVGAGGRVVGMATAWGVRRDIIEAYRYLAENYDLIEKNKVWIFGFSRGAFEARILAALLYVAGIDESIKRTEPGKRDAYIYDIYNAYKSETLTIGERREAVALVVTRHKKELKERECRKKKIIKKECDNKIIKPIVLDPVSVQFMGLWDTVEAFGLPDRAQNVGEPNTRYADQLCNIKYATHAVAIDDDRAKIFTPILLTQQHLIDETCDKGKFNRIVKEVWFSGAHSDVGGGYNDTNIGGVSLNWMLAQIEEVDPSILPEDTSVYSDYLDKTHDPEKGLWGLIYEKVNRDIAAYTNSKDYKNYSGKEKPILKIHQSVLDRLCTKSPESFESFWFKKDKYKDCILCDSGHGSLASNRECRANIKVENDSRYKKQHPKPNLNNNNTRPKLGNYCDEEACWDAHGENYALTKACNYDHPRIFERAEQRLKVVHLNSSQNKPETIFFYADTNNDRTGIYLKGGIKYKVTVDKKSIENWVDCTIPATYHGGRNIFGSKGSFLTKLGSAIVKPFSYAPTVGYMALLGEVAGQQFLLGKLAKNNDVFIPKGDGELILRVNEPRFMDTVYKNNHGMLKLTIEAID